MSQQSDKSEDQKKAEKELIKKQGELDQALAMVADNWPPVWFRIFTNLKERGFTEDQSMDLLKTYIIATQATNGVNWK